MAAFIEDELAIAVLVGEVVKSGGEGTVAVAAVAGGGASHSWQRPPFRSAQG